ncbi:MAG: serine protease (plasmid) [Leptolyngbya sp. BL-A-14]
MLPQRLAIFAGMMSLAIVGGLHWQHPLPVMARPHLRALSTNAPASFQVAKPTQSNKHHFSTVSFIPTSLQQSANPNPGSRNIFGKDERIPMNSSKYPWSAIGRIDIPLSATTLKICTGTLIAKNIVLTNAHCVVDEATGAFHKQPIVFRPNLVNGQSHDQAKVIKVLVGTKDIKRQPGADWALLTLDQPLGEKYGFLGWINADLADLDALKQAFNLAGYSGDFPQDQPGSTAGVHKGCSIRGITSVPGVLSHDCDMTQGASGGPIFVVQPNGSVVIVAVNEAERVDATVHAQQAPKFTASAANLGIAAVNWSAAACELAPQRCQTR